MRRSLTSLLLFFALQVTLAQADSIRFNDLLIDALQGNILPVLDGMDHLNDAALPVKQLRMKHALLDRFRTEDEPSFPTTDPAIIDVIRIYHWYWRRAMRDTSTWKVQDSLLIEAVVDHLYRHRSVYDDRDQAGIKENWTDLLEKHLKQHGCFAAIGKTGQFYDLLLHMKESEVHYPVTTPEDTLNVKVVFMDSVISNGWEGFATLDTYYPGGWATNDALYCAHDSYDLTSEDFTVSYLKHEGKHFADYKRFPQLQSPDLEYRAKLVELSYADSSLYDLLDFFQRNSTYDPANGHAYANFCVIRDLSRVLFDKDREADLDAWERMPKSVVHRAATDLLRKNTAALIAAGAAQVTTLLK